MNRRGQITLTETPCPRCLALAQKGHIRPETVQRMPAGVGVAPKAHDGSGACCFDCGTADGLKSRVGGLTFEMARIAVGNDRQESYRLPGVRMGVVGIRPSQPGDLDDQHRWLDRMHWFDIEEEGDL